MNILLIEDEVNVASIIKEGLEESGYKTDIAHSGEEALELPGFTNYHLYILDIILPGMSGLDLLKELRDKHAVKAPIIMLTALNTTENIVIGLEKGADDYLGKPFKFKELLARIRSIFRREEFNQQGRKLKFADVEMNLDAKTVTRAGNLIKLTTREFKLLEFLAKNAGTVKSRQEILEEVWGVSFDINSNVVDVYINYLRNKIDRNQGPRLIRTVTGAGYVMRENF